MQEAFDENKGGLHRALGVKAGTTIPKSRVREAAAQTKDPHLRAMAQAALNAAGWRRKH
jgi:hypothetical protein